MKFSKIILILFIANIINHQSINSFTITHSGYGDTAFNVNIATGERGRPDRQEILKTTLTRRFAKFPPDHYRPSKLPLRVTVSDISNNGIENKFLIDENTLKQMGLTLKDLQTPFKVNILFAFNGDIPGGIKIRNTSIKIEKIPDEIIKTYQS